MIALVSALLASKSSTSVLEYTSAGTPALTLSIASNTVLADGIWVSVLDELNVVTMFAVSTLAVNKPSTSVLVYASIISSAFALSANKSFTSSFVYASMIALESALLASKLSTSVLL